MVYYHTYKTTQFNRMVLLKTVNSLTINDLTIERWEKVSSHSDRLHL